MDFTTKNPEQADAAFPDWKKKTILFLSSQGMSLLGSMLVQYAIIWYVTLSTQSGAVLTISTVAGFLPQIVISLFAGVWADRFPRKRLIIFADALTAVSTMVLAVFFLMGYRELWLIFLISAIRSLGAGIQAPAVNALLPQIAPTEKLIKVNSINGTIQPIIMIVAPLVSGAMLAYYRLEAIFFIDLFTAILAITLLLALKVPPLQRAAVEQRAGYLDDLKAGLAYIGQNSSIKRLFLFFAFISFLIAPIAFLTPLMVARSFGKEVWMLTASEVVFFAGSILGGIIMTAWGGFKNRFRTIGLSCILWAVLFTGLGFSKDFYVYLAFMFLSGFPMPFWSASAVTLLQEMVAPEVQGRVFGVQQLIMNTVMPVGMLVFGPLADVVSVETLLIISSVLMAFPGIWIFLNRQPITIHSQPNPADFEMQTGD